MKAFFDFTIKNEMTVDGKQVQFRLQHNKIEGLFVDFTSDKLIRAEHLGPTIIGVLKAYSKCYSNATRKALTPGQKSFYDKIVKFHKTEGRPPSYEEQRILIGARSKGTPWQYAKKLAEKGWVWTDTEGFVIPYDVAAPEMID